MAAIYAAEINGGFFLLAQKRQLQHPGIDAQLYSGVAVWNAETATINSTKKKMQFLPYRRAAADVQKHQSSVAPRGRYRPGPANAPQVPLSSPLSPFRNSGLNIHINSVLQIGHERFQTFSIIREGTISELDS
ncbi:hypothetical protein M514_06478 [Trichuris suis]|uniref:Uncharacterized protein n=1 Tax=Trichuris suis TaxID=68888 RepID=A0A085M5Y5_9BILA|nr:hypothetical protein M513_06478 [Trichuris suis]KFD63868.1 hypothetical protein M514_06478 [Trichuris suis]